MPVPWSGGSVPAVTFPRRLLVEGEELVLDLRPHWIALAKAAFFAVVVAVAWILILPRLPKGSFGDVLLWATLAVGILILIWFTVRDVVSWLTSNSVARERRLLVAGSVGRAVDVVAVTPEDVDRYRDALALVIVPALPSRRSTTWRGC